MGLLLTTILSFKIPEKTSLLSRLFRRSSRSKQRQIETYSAQFPPAEWFNSKAVHLHSIGTQTSDHVMNSWTIFECIEYNLICFFFLLNRRIHHWRTHSPTLHSMMDQSSVTGRRRYHDVTIGVICPANRHLSYHPETVHQFAGDRRSIRMAACLDQLTPYRQQRHSRNPSELCKINM